jgi:hypothetical protein
MAKLLRMSKLSNVTCVQHQTNLALFSKVAFAQRKNKLYSKICVWGVPNVPRRTIMSQKVTPIYSCMCRVLVGIFKHSNHFLI